MAPFRQVLDRPKATAIRDYIIQRAHEADAVQAPHEHRQPDLKKGATIAAQGSGPGGIPCAQCHIPTGAADASGQFPRISGQPDVYLSHQLRDFVSGVRSSPVMSCQPLRALSSDQIDDVAGYYASLKTPPAPPASNDPQLISQDKELAEKGLNAKGIPACVSCHGVNGIGEAPTIPYLGGQHAGYTAAQLQMWQQGVRRNSPTTMVLIAKQLDAREIAAIAAYYQLRTGSP